MNYRIRRLKKEDVPAIFRLSSKIIVEDFPDYTPEVAMIYGQHVFSRKYFRDFIAVKANRCFGVFEGKKLVGMIGLKGDFGGVIYIDLLLVKKENRGQGLGLRLLKKAEDWALRRHCHYLWLFTESEKNIAFYKRRGFRYVGTHENSWFGANEHIMGKVLRQPFREIFDRYLRKRAGC